MPHIGAITFTNNNLYYFFPSQLVGFYSEGFGVHSIRIISVLLSWDASPALMMSHHHDIIDRED